MKIVTRILHLTCLTSGSAPRPVLNGWGSISRVCTGIASFALACSIGLADQSRFEGRPVGQIDLEADGPLLNVDERELKNLILLREGEPFSASDAKRSLQRLFSTQVFHDIQLRVESKTDGQVDVTFLLIRNYRISRLSFSGRLRIDSRQLRRELGFRIEDPFSEVLLEESLSRLRSLYQRHGYYRASIQPDFELDFDRARMAVQFAIDAGDRARVAALHLDVESEHDPARLQTILKLRPGSLYSAIQLEQDLEELERHFARQGYLRPNIYLRDGDNYDESTNTVSLNLRILPREKYQIEFTGIDHDEEDLTDLPFYRERSTAAVLLEASAEELRERLQRQGYYLAEVDVQVTGSGRDEQVHFRVNRGRRYRLSKIEFEGNKFAESGSLHNLLAVDTSGFFRRGRFTSGTAEADVNRIEAYYRQSGFLDVKAEFEISPEANAQDRAWVLFRVIEGPRYRVENITIEGNRHLDSELLRAELTSAPGSPFSPLAVAQDRANLIALYENEGFREIDFRSQITYPEPTQVNLTYMIEEGSRFFVDQTVTTGHLRTRLSVVRRETRIQPNQPLSLGDILQTETNLYNLGVFTRAQIQEVPSYRGEHSKNVILSLEEAPRYTLLYGFGFSSFEGARGTFGVTDSNLLGLARSLSLGLRFGAQRQRGNLSYSVPDLAGGRIPTIFALAVDNERRLAETERGTRRFRGRPFDTLRITASTQSERRLSRRESFFFRYRFEQVQVNVPPGLESALQFFREERNLRLSSFSLSYINESRDEPLDPLEGFVLSGEAQIAARAFASEKQYFRILTQGQYYYRLLHDLLMALSLRIGYIYPFGDDRTPVDNPVPISERFFSGGSTTLRGLPLDLAGPLLRDPETDEVILVDFQGRPSEDGRPVPLGGNFLAIGNLEFRFPARGLVTGALFYDVGNIFTSIRNMTRERFSNTVGLGIRFRSPVGPLRVDAGYNPNPPDTRVFNRWVFHFTLGHPF